MSFKRIFSLLITVFTISIAVYSQNNTWKTYIPDSHIFSVDMPGLPEKQVLNIKTEFGVLSMNLFIYQTSINTKENQVYLVMYGDYPSQIINSKLTEKLDNFFKNAINGAVKNVQGVLLFEKDITLNNYLGKEIKISCQNGASIIIMRQYLVENRTYMLQVTSNDEKKDSTSIVHFLNSFTIKQ